MAQSEFGTRRPESYIKPFGATRAMSSFLSSLTTQSLLRRRRRTMMCGFGRAASLFPGKEERLTEWLMDNLFKVLSELKRNSNTLI